MANQDFSALLDAAPDAKPTAAPQPAVESKGAMDFSLLLDSAPDAKPAASSDGLFDSLIWQESRGRQLDANNAPITSKKGAIGIAQVMPGTAPEAARLAGLPYDDVKYRTDAEYNKALGRAYFNKQLEEFGDPAKALAAYNAGPGAVRKSMQTAEQKGNPDGWLNHLPEETRKYVPAVIARAGNVPSTQQSNPYGDSRVKPVQPRTWFEAINDTVIEAANAAAGGVKAVGDMVSPGNSVSKFIDENIIKAGEASQSDQVKAEKARLASEMQSADGAGQEVAAFLGYMARNPVLTAAQIGGMFAVPATSIKGATALSKIMGASEATALAVGTGAASVISGAMSGGDAAGNAYELVMKTPPEVLAKSPEVQELLKTMSMDEAREHVAQLAAREASKVPAAIGAMLGPLGAERIIAGAGRTGSRTATALKTGAVDATTGGFEEGATQFEGQAAASQYNPTIDPMKGVAGAATAGAVMEAGPGIVSGAMAPEARPVPPELKPVADKAAEPNSPLSKAAMAGVDAGAPSPNEQAAQEAAAQAKPIDPISQRVAEIEAEVRANGVLETLRTIGQRGLTEKEFLEALAIARNPTLDEKSPLLRERALESLEEAMGWAREGKMPGLTQERGLATVPGAADLSGSATNQLENNGSTIDVEATRVDNMLPGPKALPAPAESAPNAGPQVDATSTSIDPASAQEQMDQANPVTQADPSAQAPQSAEPVEMSTQTGQDISSPPVQQTVDQATEGLPRVQIPAATDADRGEAATAARRKRKAQIQQLVGVGFDTVERQDSGFILRNTKTGQEVTLDSAADSQLARAAIKARVDELAHTAASSPNNDRLEPTEAQIAAGNYKKSDVIDLNGVKIKIENPAGSTRRGTSPDGKPWETTMTHHYGEIQGTEGADGDKVDVFIGNRPDSNKVFVVDQVNTDGSFDEHKLVFGATSEEDARQTYLANYEQGWQGLGAIKEIPVGELKSWLKTGSKRPASESDVGAYEFSAGGKTYRMTAQQVDSLPDGPTSAPREKDGALLTKAQALAIKAMAGFFGKEVKLFDGRKSDIQDDGFVLSNDPTTIHLNVRSTRSHMAVFGHELLHILKQENPKAYAAIRKVLAKNVSDAKGFRAYYNNTPLDQTADGKLEAGELEELASDLNGDLLTDGAFWKSVFDQIQADNGKEAKGIIAQLSAFLQKLIANAADVFKGAPGFNSARFVKDMDAVRDAYRGALAQWAKEQGITKQAMQADVQRASQKVGGVKPSTKRSDDGLTVEGYHFSQQPRQILSTGFFGTGLRGSDRDEIMSHPDRRVRERMSFYVNKGTGVRPESGVGGIAHKAQLKNIYDADADMKRLKEGRGKREFEQAVINEGYSGYLSRLEGDQPGQVILLGQQVIKPEILGMRTKVEEASPVPAPQKRPMNLGDKIMANKSLPAGQVKPERWASILMSAMPEEAAQLLDVSALGDQPLYKDELVSKLRSLQSDIKRSAQRAKDEYAEVEAKYKGTDQWMKTPRGGKTKLTERQWVQVRTPSFKSWFGDWEAAAKAGGVWAAAPGSVSTVVDDDGEPLVVYHGTTTGGFTEFNTPGGKVRGDLGIFTTDDFGMASSYVRRNGKKEIDLSQKDYTKEQLEEIGYSFEQTSSGMVEVIDTDGYSFDGPKETDYMFKDMESAVAALNKHANEEVPAQSGVYALFMNLRSPNESHFEGANWDGSRDGQYMVVLDGEPQYTKDFDQLYFDDRDDAEKFASTIDGAEVVDAEEHYESTDSVVREGVRSGDGAIIRQVRDDGGSGGYWGDPADVFVAKLPNQVKSADYNDGTFSSSTDDLRRSKKRGVAVDREEVMRFSRARKDQKIDPRRVPAFKFSDHVGRFMFATIADRTAAGGEFTGIDGAGARGVPKQGGPGFPLLSRNYAAGVIWANEGPAVAGRKKNIIDQYGNPLMAVSLGELDMHKSNATTVLSYLRTIESYIASGRINPADLAGVTDQIRLLKLNSKNGENPDELASFPGFDNQKKLHKYIDSATFTARAAIVDELGKARSELVGLPSADKVIRKLTDPEYAGSRHFDTVLILEPHTEDTFIRLGEGGTDKHLSYSYAIKGKVVGKLETPVNAREIWSDWWREQYAKKLDEKKRFQQAYLTGDASKLSKQEYKQFEKLVKNKSNLEKLLAGDFDALIGMDRAFALSMPVVEITADLAGKLDKISSSGAPNAATARAAVSFMNNDWSTSDDAKNKGGISPADFSRELRQSDSSATLDQYSERSLVAAIRGWDWEDVGGKRIKKPVQKMKLFQLRDQRIQFALKYGAPYTYEQTVPGVTDNEVTLTSVVNNEDGVNGIGGPAIMIKAIEEGATFLDAYSVTSQRFPGGFLPTLYNEYGFEEVGRVPADPQYITEDHKYAWKQFGWKEGDKLPDIVMMKWKGKDEQRKGLLERYLREGAESLRRNNASATAEGLFHELAGRGNQSQRAESGSDRGAGGDQGNGDRASLASRAFAAVEKLRSLNDDQLRNLGLDPKQVRQQPQESGVKLSPKRLSSADRIKWRELRDVKKDIGLDALPKHIAPFGNFMRYMAQKAAVGAMSPRDVVKAYVITRSSVNRSAISVDKAKSGGLDLPGSFSEPTVRPEGAMSYWLLSDSGQDYLNDAELGIVNEDSIDSAVSAMKPFGMSNTLGDDMRRAVTDDIGGLSMQIGHMVSRAHRGERIVEDWQRALDRLYGIGYAKKGFMGALLGYGQLPTFDARQINIQVERESRDAVLSALGTKRAPEVVETLSRRLDALDLSIDSEFEPFRQHLVHHAVWDAVGKSETTHGDVVDAMLRASKMRSDDEIVITSDDEVEQRVADEVDTAQAKGRKVSYDVTVEDTGESARMTVDAGDALSDYDQRIDTMKKLMECLNK